MTAPTSSHDTSDRVLSTLNRDGTRRWLNPRLSPGRFLTRRRFVAYTLIVVYNLLPWITINGKPSILLDLPKREFTFFGTTFLPTDTLILMLFMAGVFVTVFLVTALFGRLWCGWACPQTVYMEFVYRPIERFFDGTKGRKRFGGAGFALKYVVFLIVSLHLAHTFLAYFVGAEQLFDWTRQSPFVHPTSFLIVAVVTGLMMFDFSFFREQVCIVACPYGRMQSVMLDRSSLIVGYDVERGEPRGAKRRPKKGQEDVPLPKLGDCIDCTMCVTTCPTGIDIRDGLQMECIGCAQCIDACDAVMEKIGRPKGLIRYSSQVAMEEGKPRLFRPRVVIYPAFLLLIVTLFVVVLVSRPSADVTLLRAGGSPYRTLSNGMVANDAIIKITNRSEALRRYDITAVGLDGAILSGDTDAIAVEAGGTVKALVAIAVPPTSFDLGRASIELRVTDDAEFEKTLRRRLQGPFGPGGGRPPAAAGENEEASP